MMGMNNNPIQWYPGHMAKAKKEIKEKLNLIDIVYELVDARMPLSSKNSDLDTLLQGKPRILILTKYDMCDPKETDRFVAHYRKQGYLVVAVDLMHGKNLDQIIQLSKSIMTEQNKRRNEKGLKPRAIRALVVGVPNVGKSTFINRMVGKKAVLVGNKPGVTKALGWIRINKDIELLDSPGILWPKIENQETALILASLASIKEEIIDLEQLSAFVLRKMFALYPERLKERYGIDTLSEDLIEEYDSIGKRRGCLRKGGIVDYEKVYVTIINDLKEGRFGPVTFDRMEQM